MTKYYLVHTVIDPSTKKIMKILDDGYLYASYYSGIYGLYYGELLEYVYLSLLGDKQPFHGGVNFILDPKMLIRRSFRYALKWAGSDLDETKKINPGYHNIKKILDRINDHMKNLDDYQSMYSHEILLKKKINIKKYLVAICCKNILSDETINYLRIHYPNVKILDDFPINSEKLKNISKC
jgi:hypothetical protein